MTSVRQRGEDTISEKEGKTAGTAGIRRQLHDGPALALELRKDLRIGNYSSFQSVSPPGRCPVGPPPEHAPPSKFPSNAPKAHGVSCTYSLCPPS